MECTSNFQPGYGSQKCGSQKYGSQKCRRVQDYDYFILLEGLTSCVRDVLPTSSVKIKICVHTRAGIMRASYESAFNQNLPAGDTHPSIV